MRRVGGRGAGDTDPRGVRGEAKGPRHRRIHGSQDRLKEWAYAGTTFALAMAFVAAYAIGDGPRVWAMPLALLALLIVSYLTRPASRRLVVTPLPGAL